ncbi:14 kDa proline-rich protein [Spatholobus suberectus]|nr:14 kDa proline-rich protein [Spatholobus suberectus]
MASKASTYVALLLCLNLLSSTMVSSAPPPPPMPSQNGTCPIDIPKLGVCANLVNLVNVTIVEPTCCSLIQGLVGVEPAVCLCTAIKAGVLGNNLNATVSLNVILNSCGRNNTGYQCA